MARRRTQGKAETWRHRIKRISKTLQSKTKGAPGQPSVPSSAQGIVAALARGGKSSNIHPALLGPTLSK